MYLFQTRRFLRYANGKGRIKEVFTPWRTIERMITLPDLRTDLVFPSGLVQFRLVRAGTTIWRSGKRQPHKYQHHSLEL